MTLCRRATDFGIQRSASSRSKIFVAESAQLPARMQFGGEIENVLIEERVTNFDRRMHRHAVALGLQEMARQQTRAPPSKRRD